jgi:alkylhydroperoxidase family enzyme
MSRVERPVAGKTELDQVWGLRPHFYKEFMADHARSIARVDPVILELCRLHMATVFTSAFSLALRYRPALDAGLTEEKIAAIPRAYNSPLFSPAERQCLQFAEQFAIQASSIDDGDVKKLEEAIGVEPMIYLIKALSVMDQLQRSTVAFRLAPPTEAPDTLPDFEVVQRAA